MAALEDVARVIAYDRRGYGASGAPEPYEGTTVEEQAEDAAALLRALDAAPAVVFGDGFGALVALDLVKRHAALVRAVVLATRRCSRSCPRPPRSSPSSGPRSRRRCAPADPRPAWRPGWAAAPTPLRSSAPAPPTARSSPTTPAWPRGPCHAASCVR